MRLAVPRRSLLLALLGLPFTAGTGARAAPPQQPRDADRPYGLEKRVPWTTSRVHGSPVQ